LHQAVVEAVPLAAGIGVQRPGGEARLGERPGDAIAPGAVHRGAEKERLARVALERLAGVGARAVHALARETETRELEARGRAPGHLVQLEGGPAHRRVGHRDVQRQVAPRELRAEGGQAVGERLARLRRRRTAKQRHAERPLLQRLHLAARAQAGEPQGVAAEREAGASPRT
jgi:hypothetical protein